MAKDPKKTPRWYEERMERSREFRALLERRLEVDARLRAEREARKQGEQNS